MTIELAAGFVVKERYRIEHKLGEGGMGVVFAAFDLRLERPVALKILPQLDRADRLARFDREARAIGRLSHPNIIGIYDSDRVEQTPFMVVELLEGQDLRRARLATVGELLDAIEQVCDALQYAHSQGIVHRDVKPENVMVLTDGRAKLLDFGLASFAGAGKVTRTGVIPGTLPYLAPELLSGHPPSPHSDMYALGVVLFELLAGCYPFPVENIAQSLLFRCSRPADLLERHRADLPDLLRAACDRTLLIKPEERFGSMLELGLALKHARSKACDLLPAAVAQPQLAHDRLPDLDPLAVLSQDAASRTGEQQPRERALPVDSAPASTEQPTSGKSEPTERSRQRRIGLSVALIALIALALAAGVWLARQLRDPGQKRVESDARRDDPRRKRESVDRRTTPPRVERPGPIRIAQRVPIRPDATTPPPLPSGKRPTATLTPPTLAPRGPTKGPLPETPGPRAPVNVPKPLPSGLTLRPKPKPSDGSLTRKPSPAPSPGPSCLRYGTTSGRSQVIVAREDELGLLVGLSRSRTGESDKISLMRVAPNGSVVWERRRSESGTQVLMAMMPTRDGGVILGGTSALEGDQIPSPAIVRYTKQGVRVWTRRYKNAAKVLDVALMRPGFSHFDAFVKVARTRGFVRLRFDYSGRMLTRLDRSEVKSEPNPFVPLLDTGSFDSGPMFWFDYLDIGLLNSNGEPLWRGRTDRQVVAGLAIDPRRVLVVRASDIGVFDLEPKPARFEQRVRLGKLDVLRAWPLRLKDETFLVLIRSRDSEPTRYTMVRLDRNMRLLSRKPLPDWQRVTIQAALATRDGGAVYSGVATTDQNRVFLARVDPFGVPRCATK